VEHVGYLKTDSVHEHQVSADEYVPVPRIRRRKHDLQLLRTRLHSAAKSRRQSSIDDQLTLESRRQAIALGQAARQMRIVGAIPIVNIAVAISVVATPVTIAVFAGLMPMTVIFMAVLPAIAIIAIPIVFVVAVAMALRHRHRCREC
jgi:hypothetical protein